MRIERHIQQLIHSPRSLNFLCTSQSQCALSPSSQGRLQTERNHFIQPFPLSLQSKLLGRLGTSCPLITVPPHSPEEAEDAPQALCKFILSCQTKVPPPGGASSQCRAHILVPDCQVQVPVLILASWMTLNKSLILSAFPCLSAPWY